MWKYNIRGIRPWFGQGNGRGKGKGDTATLVMYYDNEQHPTVRFERIREGVDDYKYIFTLSEYIKRAEAEGKDTSSAKKVIKAVTDQIPYSHKKHTKGFDYLKMDELRFQIGQEIVKLAK